MNNHITINGVQSGFLDYEIGDKIMNDTGKYLGVCTGFTHNDTCILINGKCWGGKYYFFKLDTEDIDYEII